MKSNPKNKEEAKKLNAFQSRLDEEVKSYWEKNNKAPSNDEVQGMADKLLIKGKVPGSGMFGLFEKQKSVYESAPNEKLEIDVEDVPMKERQKIEAALGSMKKPITDANILLLYKRKNGLK